MGTFFTELWKSRALVAALVRRSLAARYRGSSLGLIWTVLNPLMLMGVYTLVFQFYLRFDGIPNYPVFVFCGLLPWIWLTQSVSESAVSISGSGHLITKSLFPAQVLALVPVLSGAINYLLSIPVLIAMALILGASVPMTAFGVVAVVLIQVILLSGVSFFVSALNVQYRDVQHLIGHAFSLLFFLTPIVYPASQVPERFRWILELNPVALLIGIYHDLLYSGVWPPLHVWGMALGLALLLLVIGVRVFESKRESFAEML